MAAGHAAKPCLENAQARRTDCVSPGTMVFHCSAFKKSSFLQNLRPLETGNDAYICPQLNSAHSDGLQPQPLPHACLRDKKTPRNWVRASSSPMNASSSAAFGCGGSAQNACRPEAWVSPGLPQHLDRAAQSQGSEPRGAVDRHHTTGIAHHVVQRSPVKMSPRRCARSGASSGSGRDPGDGSWPPSRKARRRSTA